MDQYFYTQTYKSPVTSKHSICAFQPRNEKLVDIEALTRCLRSCWCSGHWCNATEHVSHVSTYHQRSKQRIYLPRMSVSSPKVFCVNASTHLYKAWRHLFPAGHKLLTHRNFKTTDIRKKELFRSINSSVALPSVRMQVKTQNCCMKRLSSWTGMITNNL